MMDYSIYTFPNGLRLAHLPIDTPVSYCGFAVNAGSRDENSKEFGLAHFVEHMLFKGTEKRRAWHIINRMDNVGGEVNAYTTKEDTFIYSIFMESDFERAFELLNDIVFHSRFPANELVKEREVIVDEIDSYEDSPSELIFDEFENLLFDGHSLGHNILGDRKSLARLDTQSGLSFTNRFYTPENMIFFSMGRIDFRRVVRMAEKYIESGTSAKAQLQRKAPSIIPAKDVTIDRSTHQAHVMIGSSAYSMFDEKRIALFLLNNLLGGPSMNNILNLALREKRGLVYTVESNITTFTDCGLFSIYFGTEPKHRDKAIDFVLNELAELRKQKISELKLSAAKKQAIGQLGVANDNRENLFLGFGKSMLHYNLYDSLPEVFAKIERLTADDLLAVADEVFAPERLFKLTYL